MRGRLGMAYDVNGFTDAALTTYQQAEALDPADFRWPYFRAALLAQKGQHQLALDALQPALDVDAAYAPAWLWRGTWLLRRGQGDEALVAFDRAASIEPSAAAEFGRARALSALGKQAEALVLLRRLAPATGHPHVYRLFGEALRATGDVEAARRALVRGRGSQPVTWADARMDQRITHTRGFASYELAKSLSASGEVEAALAILQRLQARHPESACGRKEEFFLACNLMNSTSIAYDRQGLPTRALETVRRGLSINPDFMPFHLTMVNLYRADRNLDRALTHIDRAVALSPQRGHIHEQRGRILFGLGQHNAARAAFQTALDLEPQKRTTLFYLGLVGAELKDWETAAEHFGEVVRIEPDFVLGHTFLARSLGEAGDLESARLALETARSIGADRREVGEVAERLRELSRTRAGG